jgi:ribosomal protein S27E
MGNVDSETSLTAQQFMVGVAPTGQSSAKSGDVESPGKLRDTSNAERWLFQALVLSWELALKIPGELTYRTLGLVLEDTAMHEGEKTCEECGSIYKVTKFKTIMKDKDSIACEVCGRELLSWNGGAMYQALLIKRGATKQTET